MKKLTVIDLDGTYVLCNTLHVYIRCGLRRMWARKMLWRLLKMLSLLALRKTGLIDHPTMKFGVSSMIDSNDEELREMFVAEVLDHINTRLADRLAGSDARVLLATAALDVYVPWIWTGDYVATKTVGNTSRLECRGEEKLRQVEKFASDNGLILHDFYTDNIDDLPLIKRSTEAILVNADHSTIEQLRRMDIRFDMI